MKNMEPLPLPLDPAPNCLLLQGGKVSSHSSSELSSLEGIWLVRKGEKVRENERKWRKVGNAERLAPKNFINEGDSLIVLGLGAFIAKPQYKLPKTTNPNTISRRK